MSHLSGCIIGRIARTSHRITNCGVVVFLLHHQDNWSESIGLSVPHDDLDIGTLVCVPFQPLIALSELDPFVHSHGTNVRHVKGCKINSTAIIIKLLDFWNVRSVYLIQKLIKIKLDIFFGAYNVEEKLNNFRIYSNKSVISVTIRKRSATEFKVSLQWSQSYLKFNAFFGVTFFAAKIRQQRIGKLQRVFHFYLRLITRHLRPSICRIGSS